VPDDELTLTTERIGDACRNGSASRMRKNGALTLTATCSSKPSAFHSWSGTWRTIAALFTSPSTVPKRSTASLTMRPVLLTFDKSATTQWASPPASCTARALSSSGSILRPTSTT
jgi:hypothetical protein